MFRLLLILSLFVSLSVRGQKQGMALADSLSREIRSPRFRDRNDTPKAKLLVWLATAFYPIPDSSIKYATLGVQLSQKLGWEHGIAIANTCLCYDYSAKSDFAKAIDCGKTALAINEKQGMKKDAISSLGNIANCYLAQSNYEEAIDLLLRDLALSEQVGDKSLLGLVTQSLGIVYDQLKDNKKSKQYYQDALKIFEQIHDRNNIAVVLTNLAGIYENEHDYAKALSTVLRGIKIFEEMGNQYALMVAVGVAGGCYRNLHNYPQALVNYRKTLQLTRELGSIEYAASGNKGTGEVFFDMARDTSSYATTKALQRKYLDSATIYLEKAVSEGAKIGVADVLAQIHQTLSSAYALGGNYKEAFEHQQAYTVAHDSMFSTDSRVKIASLETKREADLKNKQIEMNRLAKIKKRNEQALLVGGLIVLFIAVIAVLRAHDRQKKANREKETLLAQKDMLMKEIHHRVKNNLQVISALLDLQLQEMTDEHAKEAMTESTTRVKSISLIHQQLYQHDDISSIEISKFAADLVRQVMAVFRKNGIDVTFHNDIPPTDFDIDTAVPLGLILNELITNSFKYAFTGNSNGYIRLGLRQHDGKYQLVYEDSGPGLPLTAQHSPGLGMRMMRSLSKQLGGSFAYNAEEKKVIIAFKDLQGRKMID